MVKFGMPAIETIQSATISTAQMLGIDSTLGSIEVGKIADLIAVDGNPIHELDFRLQQLDLQFYQLQ